MLKKDVKKSDSDDARAQYAQKYAVSTTIRTPKMFAAVAHLLQSNASTKNTLKQTLIAGLQYAFKAMSIKSAFLERSKRQKIERFNTIEAAFDESATATATDDKQRQQQTTAPTTARSLE